MWVVNRFFLLEDPKLTEPEFLSRKLEELNFDGERGIVNFEVWREFEESRFLAVEKIERAVRIKKISPTTMEIEEELVNLEDFAVHEFHVKSYGLVEFRSNRGAVGIAEDVINLLELVPLKFKPEDLRRIVKIADSINGAKFRKNRLRISLKGFSLTEEEEFNRLLMDKEMELLELRGKMTINDITLPFRVDTAKLSVFVKVRDEATEEAIEKLIETFVKIR